jgi:2-methylfumaryl-CoA isomerase
MGMLAEIRSMTRIARHGNVLFGAFGKDFLTMDGRRLIIIALTLRQWTNLVRATGLKDALASVEAAAGLDFSREGDRFRARDEIAKVVGAWIASHALRVASAFDRNDVCWGPYQTMRELLQNDPEASTQNPLFTRQFQADIGVPHAGLTDVFF